MLPCVSAIPLLHCLLILWYFVLLNVVISTVKSFQYWILFTSYFLIKLFFLLLQSIGELTISVEETVRNGEICYYVHAQSHGEFDNVPMGTSVTGKCSLEFVMVFISHIAADLLLEILQNLACWNLFISYDHAYMSVQDLFQCGIIYHKRNTERYVIFIPYHIRCR